MQKVSLLLVAALALASGAAPAQERFSPFVPSDQENVERMLKLANLRDTDMNRKLRGWGVDVDEKLVMESNAAAKAQGVADRVQFFHRNAFDADLREAAVIAMWLWPEMQRMLRPVILAQARPGTRVITNLWDLGEWWPPDAEDLEGSRVAMWIVPARVEGYWGWELAIEGRRVSYATIKEQRFQRVEGVARAGNRRELLQDMKLQGEDITFTLGMTVDGIGFVRHIFRGKVRGEVIEGTATVSLPPNYDRPIELPWRATRTTTSAYFAPTGTNIQ